MRGGSGAKCAVLIVGGGPAGLFLAALLAQRGADVAVLERRSAPSSDSRAIGLHPPALQALAELGMEQEVIEAGEKIRYGSARFRRRELGTLRFTRAWPDYGFVLALPQSRTEDLLEQRLAALSPSALRRGWEVMGLQESAGGATVTARRIGESCTQQPAQGRTTADPVPASDARHAATLRVHAQLVVAADGSRSPVRDLLHLSTHGREYPDTYLMGDFADPTPARRERGATVHLEKEGVVESFPLPEERRRWVVHTGHGSPVDASAAHLVEMVRERTGTSPAAETTSMLSAFAVRRRTAERLVTRRCVLIGDAAHEISPIGGQGMTLAWLDALDLAPLVLQLSAHDDARDLRMKRDWLSLERRVQHRARRAGALAGVNTVLGRQASPPAAALRAAAVQVALRTPLRHVMAWAYSMGWARGR